MKLVRFVDSNTTRKAHMGLLDEENRLYDVSAAGWDSMTKFLESANPGELALELAAGLPAEDASRVRMLAPVEEQEVWAAGVTYTKSMEARMEESEFSASAYDRVYAAERPELFFKAMPYKVVAPEDDVGIRRDGRWNVPEPELALVMNSSGTIVGLTLGNDMSSRDIEGENLLYLPQAKVYDRSCSIGPAIRLGVPEDQARQWILTMTIERDERTVFEESTSIDRIKRRFTELRDFLFRCQKFPLGAILLTGTGIVPAESFTLQAGDLIRITTPAIGTLRNRVVEV